MTESRRNEEVGLRVFRKRGDSTIVIPEQQLHLTTSRGSGLRQIKYFKLNRGRRGSVAGKAVLGGGRGRPGGRGLAVVGVGGFFPPYLLLSSFSPGRREFSFYNKRP